MTVSRNNRQRDKTEQCPYCYTYDIEGHMEDGGGDDVHREMTCNNCYAEWEVPYVMCDWVPVDIPINPIPDPDRHVVHLRTTKYLFTSSGGN